jgi:hypothetical protein
VSQISASFDALDFAQATPGTTLNSPPGQTCDDSESFLNGKFKTRAQSSDALDSNLSPVSVPAC